ncbi:MAG: hypothetical protein HRU70_14030 [Phycisphaeraceae bacterium]|nr:MAG: hypothetical protein HRU70_14030 [Phycisphaeraceae bacterium]
MAVVNIPPNNQIYNLGIIHSQLHVYDTGNPPGGVTTYDLSIPNVNYWPNIQTQQGHTQTFSPQGNAVYIQNHGPSTLQCLFLPQGNPLDPEEAGLTPVQGLRSAAEIMGAAAGAMASPGRAPARATRATVERARAFIESLELDDTITPHTLSRAPRIRDEEKAAYVNDGSLVAFLPGVSEQHKRDVLNSCLLAQLAANKKYDREKAPREWYTFYHTVMENCAWVVRAFAFEEFKASGATFDVHEAVIKVLAAIATGNDLAIIKETLDALKALSNDDHRVVLFDTSSTHQNKGTFQVSSAAETDGVVSLKLGAFHFTADTNVTRLLWFRFASSSTSFYKGAQTVTLNEEVYAKIRQSVVDKLGDKAQKFVADLDI